MRKGNLGDRRGLGGWQGVLVVAAGARGCMESGGEVCIAMDGGGSEMMGAAIAKGMPP